MTRPGHRTYNLPEVVFFQEGPGLRTRQWASEGMKVINVTNILVDGSIDISNTDKYISVSEFDDHYSHFAVEANDIVVASSGNSYGKVGRIRGEHLPIMMNTSVIRFHSKDRAVLNDEYLYAFLRSPDFRGQIESFVTGGAQPNFGPSHLNKMKLSLPSLTKQKRIADILSAYDDLIENNRRRIALLEQAARLLFREWFVHLRFPGHEHVKIIDGVPEGWERTRLEDITKLNYGKALKADERIPGPFPVYGSSGVVGSHEKALAKGPGIIIGRKGNVGSVYWSYRDFFPIDTVYYVDPSSATLYLYYSLLHTRFINTDGTVPGLNRDFAHSRRILSPKKELVALFEETATPIHDQISILNHHIDALQKARDLLLPRLMNGEIAV